MSWGMVTLAVALAVALLHQSPFAEPAQSLP